MSAFTRKHVGLRCFSMATISAHLRLGVVERPPRRGRRRDTLKCPMEHFGSGRNLAVVVALDDADPDLLVVTVMTRTR